MKNIKNILCSFGLHNWIIKKEKHKVEDHPSGRDCVRIPVRHCEWCGKREKWYRPKNKFFWQKIKFEENECLKFNHYD
jgi:hypothetical protein